MGDSMKQENETILTPEQRKASFLRSRNIDTEMDLEAQEQINKDIRELDSVENKRNSLVEVKEKFFIKFINFIKNILKIS